MKKAVIFGKKAKTFFPTKVKIIKEVKNNQLFI